MKTLMNEINMKQKPPVNQIEGYKDNPNKNILAYARLDFDNQVFFLQTLQVVIGRRSRNKISRNNIYSVDLHLSNNRSISRKHAKIFYNFGNQNFEILILGKNGVYVDDKHVEKGFTVTLKNKSKVQIGKIFFFFFLPSNESYLNTICTNFNYTLHDILKLKFNFKSVRDLIEKCNDGGEKIINTPKDEKLQMEQIKFEKDKFVLVKETSETENNNQVISENQPKMDLMNIHEDAKSVLQFINFKTEKIKMLHKIFDDMIINDKIIFIYFFLKIKEASSKAHFIELLIGLVEIDFFKNDVIADDDLELLTFFVHKSIEIVQPIAIEFPNASSIKKLILKLISNSKDMNLKFSALDSKINKDDKQIEELFNFKKFFENDISFQKIQLYINYIHSFSDSNLLFDFFLHVYFIRDISMIEALDSDTSLSKNPVMLFMNKQDFLTQVLESDIVKKNFKIDKMELFNLIKNILSCKDNVNGLTYDELIFKFDKMYPNYVYHFIDWKFRVFQMLELNLMFKKIQVNENKTVYVMDNLFSDKKNQVIDYDKNFTHDESNLVNFPFDESINLISTSINHLIDHEIERLTTKNLNEHFEVDIDDLELILSINESNTKNRQEIDNHESSQLSTQIDIIGTVLNIKDKISNNQRNTFNYDSNINSETQYSKNINDSLKKSFHSLKHELYRLYKNNNFSFDFNFTTNIINKTLLISISQINLIGSKIGCVEKPLVFLTKYFPDKISVILDINLKNSIIEEHLSSSNHEIINNSISSSINDQVFHNQTSFFKKKKNDIKKTIDCSKQTLTTSSHGASNKNDNINFDIGLKNLISQKKSLIFLRPNISSETEISHKLIKPPRFELITKNNNKKKLNYFSQKRNSSNITSNLCDYLNKYNCIKKPLYQKNKNFRTFNI